MLYTIVCQDVKDSLRLRKTARGAHIERLQLLQEQGRLILAGPNPIVDSAEPGDAGFSGSIIVAEFANLDDARTWANADPYLAVGAYADVTVKPFKQVFPQ